MPAVTSGETREWHRGRRHAGVATIAFMEAGTTDGGSMSWLLYALKFLDRGRFKPIVIFYRPATGATLQRIRELGVPTYFASQGTGDAVPRWLSNRSGFWPLRQIQRVFRLAFGGLRRDLPIILAVRKLLRQNEVSLIVLNADVHYHYWGAIAAHLQRLPILCRKAGGIGEGKRIKRFLTPWVEVFVSSSKAAETDQITNNPRTKRVLTVYEGIDISQFGGAAKNAAIRQQLGIPEGNKVVTSVARFDYGKGQLELIKAAEEVVRKYPQVTFLIVGEEAPPDGLITGSLREAVARLKLDENVIFAGLRDDVPDILAVTDVFVHCPTTWIEGLGICHLEAMAAGKPSVVSANGGLPEAAVNGVTGFVVPAGDIARMSECILRLLNDSELADRLGRGARERAETTFDMKVSNAVFEGLYEELLARGRK